MNKKGVIKGRLEMFHVKPEQFPRELYPCSDWRLASAKTANTRRSVTGSSRESRSTRARSEDRRVTGEGGSEAEVERGGEAINVDL